MAGKKRKSVAHGGNIAAENRRARFDFNIEETFEAGLQLKGTEVKSLREGRSNIQESYAREEGGEIWLLNAYIPEYGKASHFNHETRRARKLLLHKREVKRLMGQVKERGKTIIPLRIYFTPRGLAKVEIALGTGKKLYDKRATQRDRTWTRDRQRLLKRGVD